MNLYLLIVFFIVLFSLLFFMPFKSRIMSDFDLSTKTFFYSIKLWRLNLFCGNISLDNGKFKIKNTHNIFKNSYKKNNFKKFAKNIVSELNITKNEFYFTCSLANNPSSTAIICGLASSLTEMIFAYLKSQNFFVILRKNISPDYSNSNNLKFMFDLVAEISFFQITKSYFLSKKRR